MHCIYYKGAILEFIGVDVYLFILFIYYFIGAKAERNTEIYVRP